MYKWKYAADTVGPRALKRCYKTFLWNKLKCLTTLQTLMWGVSREALLQVEDHYGDLLVLTSLYQLLFKLKLYFSFFTKQPTLMRRSTVLILPLQ